MCFKQYLRQLDPRRLVNPLETNAMIVQKEYNEARLPGLTPK